MNGLDLKLLAVIGISALSGLFLTSALLQPEGEVYFADFEMEWVDFEVEEEAPEASIRWWEGHAPLLLSGPGGVRPIRNSAFSLWEQRTDRTGIPKVGSLLFGPFPSTWERSTDRTLRFEFRPLHRMEEGEGGWPRS